MFGGLFKGIERTFSSLAGRRNDRSGGPLNTLVNIAPMAVGIATGNPILAAGAGAASGALSGGARGALTGGLGSGLGAWLGNSLAFNTSQSLPALMLGKSNYIGAMTGMGAGLGSGLNQVARPEMGTVVAPNGAPINIPTFDQLRRNAVVRTQEAFDREGIYHLLNPFRRFNRDISPAGRNKYPSLKKTAKERAKRRNG